MNVFTPERWANAAESCHRVDCELAGTAPTDASIKEARDVGARLADGMEVVLCDRTGKVIGWIIPCTYTMHRSPEQEG